MTQRSAVEKITRKLAEFGIGVHGEAVPPTTIEAEDVHDTDTEDVEAEPTEATFRRELENLGYSGDELDGTASPCTPMPNSAKAHVQTRWRNGDMTQRSAVEKITRKLAEFGIGVHGEAVPPTTIEAEDVHDTDTEDVEAEPTEATFRRELENLGYSGDELDGLAG